MWVTQPEAFQQPVTASAVEPFVPSEENLAGLVERIVLASPVPEHLVLDTAADSVQATIGDPDHVKPVSCERGQSLTAKNSQLPL